METKIEQTPRGMAMKVCLSLPHGLHARPAARLAQEAQRYAADIRIVTDTGEVDAKSMLDILSLAPQANTDLLLLAEGSDAREALLGLSHFLLELQE
jgi:phosphocarrier protein HPr